MYDYGMHAEQALTFNLTDGLTYSAPFLRDPDKATVGTCDVVMKHANGTPTSVVSQVFTVFKAVIQGRMSIF